MPSWSYAQVEVPGTVTACDRVHRLVPTMGMLDTGAACPVAVVYWSTNTGCAIPATIGVEVTPTRTTARFDETKNDVAGDGVTEGVGVVAHTPVNVGAIEKGAGVTPRNTV